MTMEMMTALPGETKTVADEPLDGSAASDRAPARMILTVVITGMAVLAVAALAVATSLT
jgi:hypothetical protein